VTNNKTPRDNLRRRAIKGRSKTERVVAGSVKSGAKSGKLVYVEADTKPSKGVRKGKRLAQPRSSGASPTAREFMVVGRYLSGDGLVDVDKVTAEFGVTKASLAQSLGFAEETLQRFSRVAAKKTQQRLREMLEILTRVEPWAGGIPQAIGWYRGQGIPALGDQTAEALVKNEQAAVVRAYLDGLAAGAFA
jgi:hypothetical protein